MTANMAVATFAWLLLMAGYLLRARREVHVPLMLTGIFTDIGLVLYLEFTRRAVETAVAFTLEPLQQAHVIVSTVALVLYFPVLYLGCRLYGDPSSATIRSKHKKVAITALAFRTCGFLLMFSMWK